MNDTVGRQVALEFVANAAPSNSDKIEMDKVEWIQHVLAQMPDERRERLLFCLASYGSKVSARDPLFAILDATGILSMAWIEAAAKVGAASEGIAATARSIEQLRAVTREALEVAACGLREEVKHTSDSTKQLLEDVRAGLVQAVSPEKMSKAFSEEVTNQFAKVLQPLMEKQLAVALEVIHPRMAKWAEETIDQSLKRAAKQMEAAVGKFRGQIFGDLRLFHAALIAAGALCTAAAFVLGHFWPR